MPKNFHAALFRFALIFIFLLTATSCSAVNRTNHLPDKRTEPEKKSKVDVQKLAKEAGYMVGWDIVLALGCKAGLHLSVAVCLTADVVGDTGIILYSNLEPVTTAKNVTKKPSDSATSQNQNNPKVIDATKDQKQKKKLKFDPLEFLMGVGLMAVILVVI